MTEEYNPNRKIDRYEAELNRLAAECEPPRALTDEENIQLNNDLRKGINKFLLKDRKNKIEAEMELSKINLD
jgi:hypothetical protein